MLFNSYEFLLGFLPLTWSLYVLAGRVSQQLAVSVLLVCSIIFYFWWSSTFLLLLLSSIAFNFMLGRKLSETRKAQFFSKKTILVLGILSNIVLLAYFKYADFFVQNIRGVIGLEYSSLGIILPMGISFYTFTQIAFLVDAYRYKVHEFRLTHYGLFVTYFPHLIAGPILHHKDMMSQFSRDGCQRIVTADHISLGFAFLSIGLFKKVVIADELAGFVDPFFLRVSDPSFIDAWLAAISFTFQLYFDFSGYSDMAIGISLFFGIWLPINFNSPYKARSIAEFWRRWHMTLSRFLRDYLYIPLGGARNGSLAKWRNLLLTMILGGLWHGAGWTFIVWGALHGGLLVANHLWRDVSSRFKANFWSSKVFSWICWGLTFLSVIVGWVIFRSPDLDVAASILKGMAGLNGLVLPESVLKKIPLFQYLGVEVAGVNFPFTDLARMFAFLGMVSLAVFLFPNTQQILMSSSHEGNQLALPKSEGGIFLRMPYYLRALIIAAIALIAIGHISELSPFLYFQF